MKSIFPTGTTIHKTDQCCEGYNLISGTGIVKLINMDGEIVHRWDLDTRVYKGFIHRARLLPNGRLMLLLGAKKPGKQLVEFDWNGRETWSYAPEDFAHHDFWPTEDGSVFLICHAYLPDTYRMRITDPVRRATRVFGDELIEVDRKGNVIWRWVQHEHMDVNWCNPIPASRDWAGGPDNNTITDWTHTNTIQALPENKWYDAGDQRFKPDNILQSLRQLDTINIVDKDTGDIVWSYTGDYNGGMSGQHEPHMIEKGLPGAGNIIVFDNGASPYKDLAHCGCSYVLEINPSDNSLVWVYDDGHKFHARFTANCQRLPNGNTLILESMCRRLFEVTPDKEIVWEYILTDPAQRVYRYPCDYCESFRARDTIRRLGVEPSL
jgi:hypothetical protein